MLPLLQLIMRRTEGCLLGSWVFFASLFICFMSLWDVRAHLVGQG